MARQSDSNDLFCAILIGLLLLAGFLKGWLNG